MHQFPIHEVTLREWDASTLEDLTPPPSLPFYIPGTPDIQIHPISWIPSDMPLCMDNVYTDSRDDYGQEPRFTASCLKGKQPEHDCNLDVINNAPTHERNQFCQTSNPTRTEGGFSDPGYLILDPEQERHVAGTSLTPWNHFELNTNTADLVPGLSVAPGAAALSPNNFSMLPSLGYPPQEHRSAVLPNHLSSLPLNYDIECSLPSWAPVSLTPSHAPIRDLASYTPRFSCPMEEPFARYESPENFDCASDSPSDNSDSTTHTSFVWVDSEPSSPEVFMALQDDFPPFPTIDNSDVPLRFDSPSVANAEVTGGSLLRGLRPTLETREPVPSYNKRKRLFVAEEDEYGARARKQPRIEQ